MGPGHTGPVNHANYKNHASPKSFPPTGCSAEKKWNREGNFRALLNRGHKTVPQAKATK